MAFSARGKERLIEKSKGLESWKLSVASFLYVHPVEHNSLCWSFSVFMNGAKRTYSVFFVP